MSVPVIGHRIGLTVPYCDIFTEPRVTWLCLWSQNDIISRHNTCRPASQICQWLLINCPETKDTIWHHAGDRRCYLATVDIRWSADIAPCPKNQAYVYESKPPGASPCWPSRGYRSPIMLAALCLCRHCPGVSHSQALPHVKHPIMCLVKKNKRKHWNLYTDSSTFIGTGKVWALHTGCLHIYKLNNMGNIHHKEFQSICSILAGRFYRQVFSIE